MRDYDPFFDEVEARSSTPPQFDPLPLRDLLNSSDTPPRWLWDGFMVEGGLTILSGRPKSGKSTLARQLALMVARGESCLGRSTVPGPVVYLGLEDHAGFLRESFRRLGAEGNESLWIHVGTWKWSGLSELSRVIRERKAALVVVDPLFRFLRLSDLNDYIVVSEGLEPLLELARSTNCHIMALHHQNKSTRGQESVLGSVAVTGAADSIMLLERTDKRRMISTVQRFGEDLPPTVLNFDTEKLLFSMGAPVEEAEVDRVSKLILETLADDSISLTEPELLGSVEARTSTFRQALRTLTANGQILRKGHGSRASVFKYSRAIPI